ncbi:MAG: App1 family protein [Marinoscillum sp.]
MEVTEPILKIYKGFSNKEVTHLMGHVLRRSTKPIEKVSRNPFKNMLQMIRRYRVKPASNEPMTLRAGDRQYSLLSNPKGYFEFVIPTPDLRELTCTVSLNNYEIERHVELEVRDPDVVVVSDIDDTILVSHSTSLLKKLYLLLTKNHERRKGFRGIKHFYEELLSQNGKLFYVSSSEWNLYDFLEDFMGYNEMPKGVFLLQDLKSGVLDLFRSGGGKHSHKIEKLQKLMKAYSRARFILVGDSGQKDPEIYHLVVKENPGRVKQVFIRDVKRSNRGKLKQLAENFESEGVTFEILNK